MAAKKRLKFIRREEPMSSTITELKQEVEAVGVEINKANFTDYKKTFAPTAEEFTAILAHFHNKGWSLHTLQLMTGIPAYKFKQIFEQLEEPGPVEGRMIWMLYMIDTQPTLLNDPFNYATWGKVRGVIPKKSCNAEEVKAFLANLMAENKPRLTVKEIAAACGIKHEAAYFQAHQMGYPVKPAPKGSTTPRITDKTSIWMNVDWRKTIAEICIITGMSEATVRANRKRLQDVGRNTLVKIAREAGIDTKHFTPLFNENFNVAGDL